MTFRGSILVVADETVFCFFDGFSSEPAGEAAALAGLPVERVLETRFIGSDDGIGLSPNTASKEER